MPESLNRYRVTCKQAVTVVYEVEASTPAAAESLTAARAQDGSHMGLVNVSIASRQFDTKLLGPGRLEGLNTRVNDLESAISGLLMCPELNQINLDERTLARIRQAQEQLAAPRP